MRAYESDEPGDVMEAYEELDRMRALAAELAEALLQAEAEMDDLRTVRERLSDEQWGDLGVLPPSPTCAAVVASALTHAREAGVLW